jgi:hypothetical protein
MSTHARNVTDECHSRLRLEKEEGIPMGKSLGTHSSKSSTDQESAANEQRMNNPWDCIREKHANE